MMYKKRLENIFDSVCPVTELSQEESRIFMHVLLTADKNLMLPVDEVDKNSDTYKELKPLLDAFQVKVFLMRLKKLTNLKITLGALILLAQHFNSASDAVMYAYYLHYKLPANTLVTTNIIAKNLFSFGFFSELQLAELWNKQKVILTDGLDECECIGAYDNLLDYLECWTK